MPDMIRKLIPVEVKEVADRTLEMAGSTEDKDRMGDIIRASGWKLGPFKKNPVVLWAHNYDQPPIGRATRVWIDKETNKLMFKVEFAGHEIYEFADTIYKLYKGGFLHAVSVGFIPLDWEGKSEENPYPKSGDNIYIGQELLELSSVPVPANADALVSARDSGLITVKEFEAVTVLEGCDLDPEMMGKSPFASGISQIITKPEETENYITEEKPYPNEHACRLKDPGQYDTCRRSTRTATEPESVKGKKYSVIFCKKEDGPMEEQAYRYDKEDWTAGQAKSHCNAHDGTFEAASNESARQEPPEPKAISQAELGDELDYITQAIKEVGLNEEQMPTALELASVIIERCTGNDIPVDILSKVGAVLNIKNQERLTQIQELTQDILDSANTTEEGEKQERLPEPLPDPVAIAIERAQEAAEITNLVIARLKGRRIPK